MFFFKKKLFLTSAHQSDPKTLKKLILSKTISKLSEMLFGTWLQTTPYI
jgi:hypothetical protein